MPRRISSAGTKNNTFIYQTTAMKNQRPAKLGQLLVIGMLSIAFPDVTATGNDVLPAGLEGDWSLILDSGLPAWMRVGKNDGQPQVGLRLYVGSAGPYRATRNGDQLTFEIKKRNKKNPALSSQTNVTVEIKQSKLAGTLTRTLADGSTELDSFTGVKIPPMPASPPDLSKVRFGHPISLFNGKDLSGWKANEPEKKNGWSVIDGCLVNTTPKTDFSATGSYTNLRTEAEFEDFWLHVEFLVEEARNSRNLLTWDVRGPSGRSR